MLSGGRLDSPKLHSTRGNNALVARSGIATDYHGNTLFGLSALSPDARG